MADADVTVGSDSTHSEFEEVNAAADLSNYSDGEIIDSDWHYELEAVLNDGFVDQGIIKSVCKCRNIPEKFRTQVWKICLNVANRGNAMSSWDGKFDPSTQELIQHDCSNLVSTMIANRLDLNTTVDEKKIVDDAMAVVAFYCKCRAIKYHSNNGWMNILLPLLELGLEIGDLYNCFYAIQSRYIPRMDLSSQVCDAPFHLLRLLLLYHDPEMCNYLDTCKISTESFTKQWFFTLFSSHCTISVVSAIWDVYLQQSDPFFVFFLALVILVNAKEQVMTTGSPKVEKKEIIRTLENSPSVLAINDVDDFCQLALYYGDRTPSSFKRELGACFYSGTMVITTSKLDAMATDLAQSFCLKVSIPELLLSSQPSHEDDLTGDENGPRIRFFVVDCRPAEQYNQGHLLTAFHLDATLMLREPAEFDSALTALFAAQDQAMQAGSAAGGEHLCFIGSGNEEEDQYMYMVVANLLQKHQTYVSVARGGYASLLEYLTDVGIDLTEWIVGAERPATAALKNPDGSQDQSASENKKRVNMEAFKKMAGNVFERTKHLKEKVVKFIETTDDEWEGERPSKSTRKGASQAGNSVFSIGDDTEHTDEDSDSNSGLLSHQADIEELQTWKNKPDVKYCFECQAVTKDGHLLAAYLLLTSRKMYCLIEVRGRKANRAAKKTWVRAQPPKDLCAIVKITSRRSFPELISFKFGESQETDEQGNVKITSVDRYIIPDAGDATKSIKQVIIQAEEMMEKEKQEEGNQKQEDASNENNSKPSNANESTY